MKSTLAAMALLLGLCSSPVGAQSIVDQPHVVPFRGGDDGFLPLRQLGGGEDPVIPLAQGGGDPIFPLKLPVSLTFKLGLLCRDCPFPMFLSNVSAPSKGEVELADSVVQLNLVPLKLPLEPLVVVAVGSFTGGSYTEARLTPMMNVVEPADGIYEFLLEGHRAAKAKTFLLQTFASVQIIYLPKAAKGIRVRSKALANTALLSPVNDNVLSANVLDTDFRLWLGKRLVRRGEASPVGADVLREEDLPTPHRIFTPTSNIGDRMYLRNRINIFLDEQNVVVNVTYG